MELPTMVEAAAGLTLKVRAVAGAPVVALRVWLRGGARAEKKPGQALLSGRMLGEGTATRDFQRIAADAEAFGMALTPHGGFEIYGVALDALADDWELAVDWLAELARARREPFDSEEIERAKHILIADWVFGHERVHQLALTAGFSLALFDLDHPERQLRAVAECDADAIRAVAQRYLDPERSALLGWSLPEA